MKSVKRKVLVLSGKGGVGKSTFTAGLSWALAADEDIQVGLSGDRVPVVLADDTDRDHGCGHMRAFHSAINGTVEIDNPYIVLRLVARVRSGQSCSHVDWIPSSLDV